MSTRTVTPDQFEEAVQGILNDYSRKVINASKDAVKTTADSCKSKIQSNIGSSGIKGTGEYRNSWISELESQNDYETVYRVHAKAPYYRLTHLLEHGHQIWCHGKYIGHKTRAFAHIRPAVRDIQKEFSANLKVGMKK